VGNGDASQQEDTIGLHANTSTTKHADTRVTETLSKSERRGHLATRINVTFTCK